MKTNNKDLNNLCNEVKKILGDGNVLLEESVNKYQENTLSSHKNIKCVLLPKNKNQISEIVKLANKYNTPLYPISTGHNWGYGCSMPVQDNNILLDLHLMKEIKILDAENGIFEIEPGVTQGDLNRFLEENKLEFMVPTTGAGKNCSIIGNALERGFGLNPINDHISAINAYEAVLGTGEIYKSPLKEFGCEKASYGYKYGIGPYIDGIFAQSNYAVITKVTLQLAPIPEKFEMFYFGCENEEKLDELVKIIKEMKLKFPGVLYDLSLMNKERVLETLHMQQKMTGPLKKSFITKIMKNDSMAWMVLGGLYGAKEVVKAVHKRIRKLTRKKVDKLVFFNEKTIRFIENSVKIIPFLKKNKLLLENVKQLKSVSHLLLGKPQQMSLLLAYLKIDKISDDMDALNPSHDGVGLIWFAPVIPIDEVEIFVDVLKKISMKYKVEPAITLRFINVGCITCTFPIHFDKNSEKETQDAKEYFNELFVECKKHGYFPYRIDNENVYRVTDFDSEYHKIVKKIKSCFDPNNIIAPGKYCK